ncbi:MAG: protein-disulfide reductase DsbD family protein [Paracoccaceae bacterium]|jgi:DsbC/DsbD-like thiol-disulfide interchange protein|nr:protein-disulfide reductase DsbD family protein [Paracoccaceae bacterium]MDP5365754.1 protein-disulfide reductase DsbD family protein [Paracoccaceae bacterium]
MIIALPSLASRFLLPLLLAAGPSMPAQAGSDSPADMVRIEVLPGWSTQNGQHVVALHLALAPGWKTYWRAPGDAGIPPAMEFHGAYNLASVDTIWPTPEVFSQNGLQTVGYADELVLPMLVVPQDPGQPARLSARLQIGICNTICVPVEFDLALDLPAKGSDTQQAMIRAAMADQPIPAAEADVRRVTCSLSPISDGLRLSVEIDMPSAGGTETVLVETADPQVWVAETESTRQGQTLRAVTELVHVSGQAFALDRSGLRMTVLGAERAVDIHGCTPD